MVLSVVRVQIIQPADDANRFVRITLIDAQFATKLLPKTWQVGSGLNRGGSAPSVSHLNNLIFSSPGVSQSMTTSAFWRHYFRFAVIHPQSEASPKLGIEARCSCYERCYEV